MNPTDATDLPSASGHRFGPDLVCSECGARWDEHQRDPRPCRVEAAVDAFERRPAPGRADPAPATAAKVVTRDPAAAGTAASDSRDE